MDARKERYEAGDLRRLMRGAKSVLVAKGKKSERFDLTQGGDVWKRLAKVAIGPTGNLRAPTLKLGNRWIVGFGEDAWGDELGG